MSSGPPRAASMPREEEGNARRITYSTEFLLSVAGSDACKQPPAGVDASALSELNQATPLGRSDSAGDLSLAGRWHACSSGSSDLTERESDQLDRQPGNQYRHNWQNTDHDGLLGNGAFPRPPSYVGPLASSDHGTGYQLNRNSGRYQPPRLCKAVPVSRKDVDSINDETFGSFECSNEDRVEEEKKRRASFELMRKEQHKALQEKKNAPDSDKENLSDGIISLLQNSAGKRGPPTKSDKKDELKASFPSKDAIKTSPLLPTPKTRPLKPPGFANALPGKRLQLQSSNSSLNSESQQLNSDDIIVSSVPESSKCAKWFPDEVGSGHAEDLSSKRLLPMIVKDENLFAENIVRDPSASGDTFENLSPRPSNCEAGSKLLRFISPTPAIGTLKEYSTDGIPESVPVMTCGDLEQTMLAHVSDTSNSNQQNTVQECRTVLDEPSAAEQMSVDQRASQRILSLLHKGINSKDSSPLEFHMGPADKLLSFDPNGAVNGGTTASDPVNNTETILTSGKDVTFEALFGAAFMNGLHSRESPVSVREHTAGGLNSSSKSLLFSDEGKTIPSSIPDDHHLGEQMVLFSHSKGGAFHMKPGTGIEYGNPKFSGSSQEGANFDKKSLEIQLPEEDNLFSVNDSLHAQNTHHLPFAESARAEGLLPAKEVADLNYRFQSLVPAEEEHIQVLGHDLLGPRLHDRRDQVDPNNLYHLFGSGPSAKSPINSASTIFPPMDHIANQNRQAPFSMPQAIHRGTRCSLPQDMNSMQHVLPAPGGPRVDPVAHHRMVQHMSMPGSFPPQGLPRGVPLSQQPVRHMPGYRTEMSNVNSFQMHPHQPGYGESRMMMAGPPGPGVGVSHAGALERLIQMELRATSKQIHPAMAAPVQSFYGPEVNMNFRF